MAAGGRKRGLRMGNCENGGGRSVIVAAVESENGERSGVVCAGADPRSRGQRGKPGDWRNSCIFESYSDVVITEGGGRSTDVRAKAAGRRKNRRDRNRPHAARSAGHGSTAVRHAGVGKLKTLRAKVCKQLVDVAYSDCSKATGL
jgi:hypothetical protein